MLGSGAQDTLWPQPAAGATLLLILAGTAIAFALRDRRVRRASLAAIAAVAATALLVNQALVEAELAVRVGERLTQPLPAGKAVRDYVQTGIGFVVCLVLLTAVAGGQPDRVAEIAAASTRPRRRRPDLPPAQLTGPRPVPALGPRHPVRPLPFAQLPATVASGPV